MCMVSVSFDSRLLHLQSQLYLCHSCNFTHFGYCFACLVVYIDLCVPRVLYITDSRSMFSNAIVEHESPNGVRLGNYVSMMGLARASAT